MTSWHSNVVFTSACVNHVSTATTGFSSSDEASTEAIPSAYVIMHSIRPAILQTSLIKFSHTCDQNIASQHRKKKFILSWQVSDSSDFCFCSSHLYDRCHYITYWLLVNVLHTTTTTILRPFFRDHPGQPVPEENFWTLCCKGRLTEADTPTILLGATPSGLTSAHLHHPHIFLQARCPSCRPTNSVKALKATSAFGLGRRC